MKGRQKAPLMEAVSGPMILEKTRYGCRAGSAIELYEAQHELVVGVTCMANDRIIAKVVDSLGAISCAR